MSRLYPERPFLAASVAVFRDGKVLLGARTAYRAMFEPEEQRSAVQKLRDRLPFGGRASEDSDPEVLELGVGARIKVVDRDEMVDISRGDTVATN